MIEELGLGKVTKEVFNRSVQPFLPMKGKVELDGTTVKLTENTVIAHSPSIGVPLEALGFFAFHYAASNVASRFGKPTHLIAGIYLPLRTSEEDLRVIVKNLGDEASKYGVEVVAGQTATYYGLEIPLIASTCIGEAWRTPVKPSPGDSVVIIGQVGNEALWLNELAKGVTDETWRSYTPLPVLLTIGRLPGIKLMHDVSEGGLKGALLEITNSFAVGIRIDSDEINYAEDVTRLIDDPLRAPTYGLLVVITGQNGLDSLLKTCSENNFIYSIAGTINEGKGLFFDDEEVSDQKRIDIDEIYGSFKSRDEVTSALDEAFQSLLRIPKLVELIPEVGLNMVYSKENPEKVTDVAGLSGRVVKAMNKPMRCGEIVYGASKYLASVLLASTLINPSVRSAINIRGGNDIATRLQRMGMRVEVLPQHVPGIGCPVAFFINEHKDLLDAYMHPGDIGVEPTTTILGETPAELVNIIEELVKLD